MVDERYCNSASERYLSSVGFSLTKLNQTAHHNNPVKPYSKIDIKLNYNEAFEMIASKIIYRKCRISKTVPKHLL